MSKKRKEIAVVVTTSYKGVFFGYAQEADIREKTLRMKRARNCLYWRGVKGFLDLAVSGPNKECRIGPAADIVLQDITSVAICSDIATENWERGYW